MKSWKARLLARLAIHRSQYCLQTFRGNMQGSEKHVSVYLTDFHVTLASGGFASIGEVFITDLYFAKENTFW